MFEKYTAEARRAVSAARVDAGRRGAGEIEPAHLLLGVLEQGEIAPLFGNDIPNVEAVRSQIAQGLPVGPEPLPGTMELALAKASKRILEYAAEESKTMRAATITSGHLLLGIHRESGRRRKGILGLIRRPPLPEAAILSEHGADYDTLRGRLGEWKGD